jgi:hypothetical protein
MDQPLGRWVGNAVEVQESIDVLSGRGEPDLVELTLALGAEMLMLGGAATTVEEGRRKIAGVLEDGSALARFRRCVQLQGGELPSSTRGWLAEDTVRVTTRVWRRSRWARGASARKTPSIPAPGSGSRRRSASAWSGARIWRGSPRRGRSRCSSRAPASTRRSPT